MNLPWPETTDVPPLATGAVHVWAIPLANPQLPADELRRVLSADERDRAGRFLRAAIGDSFTVGRAGLRTILGKYLGTAPSEVPIDTPASGKPQLGPTLGSDLRFNLAHSGELALVAVTRGGEIGVDVERLRPVENWSEIASRYFHADETAAIGGDAAQTPTNFFRCWTRKEAILKALGVGIIFPLDMFRVPLDAACNDWIDVPAHASTPATRYWLAALDPGDGYVAAVAATHAIESLDRFTLRM